MTGEKVRCEERLCGFDLGAAEVKVALCTAEGHPLQTLRAPSRGHPLDSLREALSRLMSEAGDVGVRVAVTGSGQGLLEGLGTGPAVNEVVATALGARRAYPDVRTVIDLGGQSSKWILLGGQGQPDAVQDFATNGLCAAGAGAFLEQQAGRLGLRVEELGLLAATARRGATIAGRCSVFAKSDMIHLQQNGTPPEEIALGLCQALVRSFLSTVARGKKIEPPVLLVGGGASSPGLVRAFREKLGDVLVIVPPDPWFYGARGAALLAAGGPVTRLATLLAAVRSGAGRTTGRGCPAPLAALPPPHATEAQPDENPPPVGGEIEAYLGLDVGSVSTNLVLLSPDFQVLQGIYLPTRGRPVEALHVGLGRIEERFGGRVRILGAGATGSGRHLAAKAVGADVVHNEITAQLVSSLLFEPEVDTIFEIGGQDSKYISIRNGRLAEFEMNKICAGGTGSFLEEQAERLGVRIEGEFAELALRAARPCDLGTRCTVFMDAELVRAQEKGETREDLCAGLAYSVARNYLEKVVAHHPVGRHVMFQGGTASNRAVVAAFRQLLGRPVRVHPYHRISGAIGAALLAARAVTGSSRFLGFASCGSAALKSFECRQCDNRCQVNRVQLGARAVHFGDVCERYSQRDREAAEIPRPFVELFAERERVMEGGSPGPVGEMPRMGLLRASLNLEFLPYWTAFLRELGYQPVVAERTTSSLLEESACALPAEVCLPIKCAAAQARRLLDRGVERIFVPALLECPSRAEDPLAHTCFYIQQLPDMLRVEFGNRIVSAQFALGEGWMGLVEPALALAEALDRSVETVARALRTARGVQASRDLARKELGRQALGETFDRAVVVLGRPYNTHDPFLNLHLARHLERLGLPAIPWDLLPVDDVKLEARWQTVPWYYNREQLRAIELIRRDSRLFPVLVSSYGCGTDGFVVKHLEELLAGRPRLLLEFDEHRGEAGLVTRLEAFADEIEEYLRERRVRGPAPRLTPGRHERPEGRRFFLPHFSEHAAIYAGVLESAGYRATVLPPPDEETVRCGEEHASGRECHPYVILAGELVRLTRNQPLEPGGVFLFPNCTAPCLLNQYGDGYRMLLDRAELPNLEVWEANSAQLASLLGIPRMIRLYEGLLATDILSTLAARLRPYERKAGALDRAVEEHLERLARAAAGKEEAAKVLAQAAADVLARVRRPEIGTRPVVGVTGDLYTRMNPAGNAGLFARLGEMGCEVWSSPYFASMIDLSAALESRKGVEQGRFRLAAREGLTRALVAGLRYRLIDRLPPLVVDLAVEPAAEELMRLAQPYVGPRTNYLIVLTVAKIADFLRRGAIGAINAAGINCVVGTAAAAVIPTIRADFANAPVITLNYGGGEGPAQRIRLETFVHQVWQRWRARAA